MFLQAASHVPEVLRVSPRPVVGRVVVHLELHHAAVGGHDPDLEGGLQQKKGKIGGKALSAAAAFGRPV